ncbi:MAG: SprT family zinc-dependent metalloprotease [Nitrospira sp.]|nr:SprT family zinc-dependent metalloprotease [Nitrospira sp.]
MTRPLTESTGTANLSIDGLRTRWRALNVRYFGNLLRPIPIVWSRRLTSSVGMFICRGGPRTPLTAGGRSRREIRLSQPLLERLAQRTPYAEQELINTLAHEMIHQWQFDVLKRRPNHGLDFLRKMTEMNRSGHVAVTTHHSLEKEVLALSRFAWRCTDCGRIYHRQRNTIEPRRHQCGQCRGALQELYGWDVNRHSAIGRTEKQTTRITAERPTEQLTLAFSFPQA